MKQDNTLTFLRKAAKRFQAYLALTMLSIVFTLSVQTSYSKSSYNIGSGLQTVSPLMTAVNSGDLEGVKFFSKAGRGAINKKNIGGAAALHIASRNKNLEIVQILIGSGADVNSLDNERWTPLMRAAASGNSEIVSELLKNGAKANKRNSLDETAVIHATNSGCSVCLESILNYMNYKKMDEEYLDEQFEEAFLVANKKNDVETKNVLTRYKDSLNKGEVPALLSNNADDLGGLVVEDAASVLSKDIEKLDSILRRDYLLVTGRDGIFNADKKDNDFVKKDGNKQKFFFKGKSSIAMENNNESDLIDINELNDHESEKRRFYFKRSNINKPSMNNSIKDDNSKKSFLFRRNKENKIFENNLSKKPAKGKSFSFARSRDVSRDVNLNKKIQEVKKKGLFSFSRRKGNNKALISKSNSFTFTR